MYLKKLFLVLISYILFIALSYGSVQMSLGLMSHNISGMEKAPGGVSISVGKIIPLNNEFSIRPTADFSFVKKTIKLYVNDFPLAESEFNDYSYGISQRVLYKLPTDLRMYVFGDLGFGVSFSSVEFDSAFGDNEEDTKKLAYYKYNAGFQILSDSGIGGELKYGYKGNKDYKGAFADLSFVYTF